MAQVAFGQVIRMEGIVSHQHTEIEILCNVRDCYFCVQRGSNAKKPFDERVIRVSFCPPCLTRFLNPCKWGRLRFRTEL